MDKKTYTAFELAADWWWIEQGYNARVEGGRVSYDEAYTNGFSKTVRLSYLTNGLRQVNRRVSADTRMELVKGR